MMKKQEQQLTALNGHERGRDRNMRYIKNAKLVLETGILWDAVLAIAEDRIAAYGTASKMKIPAGVEVIDAKGLYVGPGFVDIHVHGYGDSTFFKEPENVAKYFLNHGTTTVIPTLWYDLSKEDMLDGITRIKDAKERTEVGKAIGGIYMEGPYMNPQYGANAENNKWRGDIVPEMYEGIVDAAGDLVKVWAVAPEREGLEPFLAYAKKVNSNVMFSVGHSEAEPEQIRKLKKYGIGLQTHCMNATGRKETIDDGVRGCGPDEYCMTDPDMYAEIICDSMGIHVKPAMLRMLLKIKGVDRLVLITDSTWSQGEKPKEFNYIADLNFDSNGGLFGSKLTMDMACKNMMMHTNCGIAQAFLMASRNPAHVIGMGDEIGSIEVGKKANMVFVDDMFHVDTVVLEGQVVKRIEG